jgi:LAS superfamily LD-carboxypeptidase LdcB
MILLFISCKEKNKVNILNEQVINSTNKIIEEESVKQKFKLTINKDFILGKYNYKKDTTFIKVKPIHSSKLIYIKKEVYDSFKKMYSKAQKDDIRLIIVSGTRNFYEQKSIWERKWVKNKNLKPLKRAKKILEYSSMPTTSRHHWGTDIDLNSLNNSYFDNGKGKKEYEWLLKNAKDFGFYQVYTNKTKGRTGYNLEKWHWSYLPLASRYLKYYNENITYKDISDFKGSELAEQAKMITEYVNGISSQAKEFE